VHLRYEDVSQDGRLVLEAMPQALGAVWRLLSGRRPARLVEGVVPILSRVVVEGGEGPIAVGPGAEADGNFSLSQVRNADGGVDRVILAMWASISAPIGRTHGPPPPRAGDKVVAGTVFAEHVFTRPFGPREDRKVRALVGLDGAPFVPEETYDFKPPESALALPEAAVAIDQAPVLDAHATVFGLDHTDSNQHVNSLVYPRLVIEAALRRFAVIDRTSARPVVPRLARAMEIAFRKPCFAGESIRIAVAAFEHHGRRGVTAAIKAEGDAASARPRCAARVVFAE
jgi:hypothetical protein